MRRDDWPVLTHGIRPAGHPGRCFYCEAPIGQAHREGCVIRERTVVVRVVVELVTTVPEDWDAAMIEFHCNDSAGCASDMIREVAELDDRLADAGGCPCRFVRTEFVREATPEDEEGQGLRVAGLPT